MILVSFSSAATTSFTPSASSLKVFIAAATGQSFALFKTASSFCSLNRLNHLFAILQLLLLEVRPSTIPVFRMTRNNCRQMCCCDELGRYPNKLYPNKGLGGQ